MDLSQALGQPPKEKVVLKAGTVVKVGGFPFRLVTDTEVEGCASNLALGLGQQYGAAQGGGSVG